MIDINTRLKKRGKSRVGFRAVVFNLGLVGVAFFWFLLFTPRQRLDSLSDVTSLPRLSKTDSCDLDVTSLPRVSKNDSCHLKLTVLGTVPHFKYWATVSTLDSD